MKEKKVIKKASLSDLIFRSIFIIFSILTVGITIHTYQLSVNTINEEIKRNLEQTSHLIDNYFTHRLAILQIRQDTDAGSLGLKESDDKDRITDLELYFSDIESKSPYNSPDFRFIEVNNRLYWNDGNNFFLGLKDNNLEEIINKNIHINTWYYIKINSSLPEAHLIVRKTPIVNSSTGKVRGYLYNAAILNNNISFIHNLKKISNSKDILIINDHELIASSINTNKTEYKEIKEAIHNSSSRFAGEILNYTDIDIKSLTGRLFVVSIKSGENVELLEKRYIYSVILAFFVLIAIAVLIRGLFEQKILFSLNSLLNYTNNVSKEDGNTKYLGSGIREFDHIGHKLEDTFIELIEAKEESYKAQAAAEKLTQVKSDFLARMSHEIRTPLNGILGISSLLKQSDLDLEQQKQVQIIHQGGEHLLAVLNDVLDYSQIEQDKLNIQCEQFILNDVLGTVSAIYSPLCHEKGINFILHNKVNRDALINSDQVRITQILFNLLSNAVKFTEAGEVKLTLSLKTTNDKTILHFEVRDSGMGISSEEQARMFEPFIQVESTKIRKFGGSGLGLAIVKQLLDLLRGTITVESTIGIGSVFKVQIPISVLDTESTSHTSEAKNNESQLPVNLDVLLIEDNKSNAYIAKAYCQKYGLNVEWKTSAKEGIDCLKARSFDLILMDNQMPEMSGIEATKYIRKVLKLTTPLYAYTADVLEESSNEFLAAGADYIITKPVKEKSIIDALVFYKSCQ